MLMKDGTVVPALLVEAFSQDTRALKIFMDMSSTYQKLFVTQALRSGNGSKRRQIEKTLEDIRKYGEDQEKS